ANYTITRNWSVTDCAGNNTQHTQVVTVQDTTNPVFVGSLPADVTVQCDNVPAPAVLSATDNCDNNVQVVYSEVFAGQDDACSANYTITRNWSVTDCAGNNTQHTQVVTVQDTTNPVLVGSLPADVTVQCDSVPAPAVLSATDNCDNNVQVVYSEVFAGQDDACSANYTITRNWSVTDCAGNNTQHTQVVTVQDTTNPVFVGSLPADVTVQCDSVPAPAVLSATDNCDNNVQVVYSEVFAGQDDACSANYTITRNWSVTDCAGNNTQHTQVVTVQDSTNPVLVGSLPADVTVQCDSVPAPAVLSATDNCDNNVQVVYSEVFAGQDDACSANYTITRNWSVTDCAGNNAQHTQVVTVQDTTNPVLVGSLPADVTVQCDSVPAPAVLSATDNCDNNVQVVYSEVFAGQDDACSANYTITRNWSVTDCAGNNAQHTQVVTVQDTTNPVFVGSLPADVTVQCDNVPAPAVLSATDNCDNNVQVVYSEIKISNEGKCASDYTLERTWTVTDCAGNSDTHKQIIKVIDTVPPFLPNPISEVINVKCNEIPEKPELQFQDNCSSEITVTYTETTQDQNEYGYVIIRVWIATDECGNSTTITQTINVSIEAFSYVYGSVCNTEAPVDLFSFLDDSIETTGTWLDVNNTGGLNGSILDPRNINPGFYVYRYTINDGNCPRIIEVYMTIDDDCVVLPCGITDLKISKVVTPGNDGYNDTFKIGGIDETCGFRYDIKLFNRWGALIYQNKDYKNDWGGKAEQAISGSNLPAGTYYYVVNIVNSGFDILDGYFYLGTKN
ncbi:MAG: gliding motility-associated C-terminal domain-containing protein, partial [Bacteroidota bacterium]